ncbi:hypothetical protein OROMI_000030 [Orobanche minor]
MSEHSSESSIPLDEIFKEGGVEKPDENKLIEEGVFLDPSLDTAGLAAKGGFSLSNVDLGGSDGGGSIGGGGSPEPPVGAAGGVPSPPDSEESAAGPPPMGPDGAGPSRQPRQPRDDEEILKLEVFYHGQHCTRVEVRNDETVEAIKEKLNVELGIDPENQLLALYPACALEDDLPLTSYKDQGLHDGAKLQLFNLSWRSIKRKAPQDEVVERDGVVEGEVTSTRRPRRVSCRHPASNPTEFVTGSEYSDGNEDPSQGSEYSGK